MSGIAEKNNTKLENGYTYFAFISYSRKDKRWARWLQSRLENYRLPTILQKENPDLPQKINPVFRDKTDLSTGTVKQALSTELQASKFLIVVFLRVQPNPNMLISK